MSDKVNVVEISPLKVGKRILLYFVDFIISFILGFVLLSAAVSPISKVIINIDKINDDISSLTHQRFEVFYNNKILLNYNDTTRYNYDNNLSFTLSSFLSYYSFLDGDQKQDYPSFGKNEENEVIKHYFVDIKLDKQTYLSTFKNANEIYDYFVFTDDNISLKDVIKDDVRLSFISPSDVSSQCSTYLSNLEKMFLTMYGTVMNDIKKNDLSYNETSYLSLSKSINNLSNKIMWNNTIATLISYFISISIIYLLFPLISKESHTPAMIIMNVERIGINNLYLLKKGEVVINYFYCLLFNLLSVLFLPILIVSNFASIFLHPLLFSLGAIGGVLLLASLIILFISPMNRSLSDYLTRTVFITSEDLDNIYRSKGYQI